MVGSHDYNLMITLANIAAFMPLGCISMTVCVFVTAIFLQLYLLFLYFVSHYSSSTLRLHHAAVFYLLFTFLIFQQFFILSHSQHFFVSLDVDLVIVVVIVCVRFFLAACL